MNKIASTLVCLVAFCAFGEPPPYNPAAVPAAAAIRQHLLNQCQDRGATLRTVRASVDCSLAAHQAYATTEKLRNMSLFRAYAAAVRRAADDVDAGRITQGVAQKIVAAARTDYQNSVQKSYDDFVRRQSPVAKPAPFNPAARMRAETDHDRAIKNCGAWTGRDVVAARTACVLEADRNFTTAIALRDMDLFYGYASFLRVDAVDAQDGRRDPAQMAGRRQILWNDFRRTLDQDYATWQSGGHAAH